MLKLILIMFLQSLTNMNFDNLLIRCSAIGKIMTEPKTNAAKAAGELSETTKTYLKELNRSIKYSRQKDFTSKEIEKGLQQEELAITLFSLHTRKYFTKNSKRINNDFLTGEPDLFIGSDIEHAEEGFDTKCSWSLWTFPDADDELDSNYYWQNMGYMALTGAKKWTTVYCLVNAPAEQITAEKQKVWYALGMPDDSNDRYMEKRREIEKNMIFDIKQFRDDNPHYDLDIKDWCYDIPRAERILQFPVLRDEDAIQKIYRKVGKCRAYMNDKYGSNALLAEYDEQIQATIIKEA